MKVLYTLTGWVIKAYLVKIFFLGLNIEMLALGFPWEKNPVEAQHLTSFIMLIAFGTFAITEMYKLTPPKKTSDENEPEEAK